jgi:uncharacterized repeat protein (TIGR03803 family)
MIPRNLSRIVSTTFAAATIVAMLAVPASAGSKGRILYAFGANNDRTPEGNLAFDSAGNLYGSVSDDFDCEFGPPCGQVFELIRGSQWQKTVLHTFTYGEGSAPTEGVVFDSKGNLYGTTSLGGNPKCGFHNYGCGTVFELSPMGNGQWTATVLHTFNGDFFGDPGGAFPSSGVTLDAAGNVYGATSYGGDPSNCRDEYGCGVVYKLSPNPNGSWTETILHAFTDGPDGAFPAISMESPAPRRMRNQLELCLR